MNHLTTWTAGRIRREYQNAYRRHMSMIGSATTAELARSADWLRSLKNAWVIAKEAPLSTRSTPC